MRFSPEKESIFIQITTIWSKTWLQRTKVSNFDFSRVVDRISRADACIFEYCWNRPSLVDSETNTQTTHSALRDHLSHQLLLCSRLDRVHVTKSSTNLHPRHRMGHSPTSMSKGRESFQPDLWVTRLFCTLYTIFKYKGIKAQPKKSLFYKYQQLFSHQISSFGKSSLNIETLKPHRFSNKP